MQSKINCPDCGGSGKSLFDPEERCNLCGGTGSVDKPGRYDGGPAFPRRRLGSDSDGLSLRDYFAAKAMQGCVSDPSMLNTEECMSYASKFAYQMADAMLKEREK